MKVLYAVSKMAKEGNSGSTGCDVVYKPFEDRIKIEIRHNRSWAIGRRAVEDQPVDHCPNANTAANEFRTVSVTSS